MGARTPRISKDEDGNEQRHVTVDGHAFVLVKSVGAGQWYVFWDGDAPEGFHPELGKLAWRNGPYPVEGATETTGLIIGDVDQEDFHRKEELLARVGVEAGLTLQPIRPRDKPEYDA